MEFYNNIFTFDKIKFFRRDQTSVQNLTPYMIFKPRFSYHFKTQDFRNLQAFQFFIY